MRFLIHLLINGFAVFVAAYILEGVRVESFLTAVIVSIVLGIVNALIKPILSIIALPITILTLGLFNFILNGLMILLVTKVVPGFSVENFWWAVLFSFVLSIVNWFLHLLTK
jgi:putative membrane protein